jgi:hypothetical protein
MNKKKATTAIFLLILSIVGMQFVELVRANPFTYPSAPSLEHPTLEVKNPTNGTTYNSSSVHLHFVVSTSKSWLPPNPFYPKLDEVPSITVTLDKNPVNSTTMPYYYLSYNFNFELNQLSPKLHTLNVTVLYYTYYKGPRLSESDTALSSSENPVYKHPTVTSDTVFFTTTEEPIIQPTPNQPPISQYPESTPTSTLITSPSITASQSPTSAEILTPSPTKQPATSPSVPEFQTWIILVLFAVASTFLAILARRAKNR